MGLVVCAVDQSDNGVTVLDAAKATGESVLMVHVSNSMLGTAVPVFLEDTETERKIEHGPSGDGVLRAAEQHDAALIVMGTRARLWPSVARYVAKRAPCPVLVVGPKADPKADPVERPKFDRSFVRRSAAPVLIAAPAS